MKQYTTKLVSLVLSLVLVASIGGASIAAEKSAAAITEEPDITIIVDGVLRSYEQPVIISGGRTFLPLRALATDLGIPNDDAHIIWNQAAQSVTLKSADGAREVYLAIGNQTGKVNGKDTVMDVAPVLYKSRTYIPVRFVADALGQSVLWDSTLRRVYIREASKQKELAAYVQNIKVLGEGQTACKVTYAVESKEENAETQEVTLSEKYSGTVQLDLKANSLEQTSKGTENGVEKEKYWKFDGKTLVHTENGAVVAYESKQDEVDYLRGMFGRFFLDFDSYYPEWVEGMKKEEDPDPLYFEKLSYVLNLATDEDGTVLLGDSDLIARQDSAEYETSDLSLRFDAESKLLVGYDVRIIYHYTDENGKKLNGEMVQTVNFES